MPGNFSGLSSKLNKKKVGYDVVEPIKESGPYFTDTRNSIKSSWGSGLVSLHMKYFLTFLHAENGT